MEDKGIGKHGIGVGTCVVEKRTNLWKAAFGVIEGGLGSY